MLNRLLINNLFLIKQQFLINKKFSIGESPDILSFDGNADQRPCNLNGGSPFLLKACSRVTGPLFTGRGMHYHVRFCLAPLEQTARGSASSRRVERPSPENTSKGNSVALPSSYSYSGIRRFFSKLFTKNTAPDFYSIFGFVSYRSAL
ncbi:hypothetical protein [Aliikangiella coralliicola]|uniref:Uncharacterized protein n=1 Tax=Aliikangiella coralliicola TaxID=2592383 RepID=A0A545UEY2_9GAMM|nr:hypothetical protein [Aliikangiella coralliicola]TQV88018.1 hypothetical protein FLL46_09410 [Aliikangiella coralliicola]